MTSLASTASATRGLEELRRDFVASLPRRLDALTRALTKLAAEPGSGARRDDVLRRVHAAAASARSLGLELSARVLEAAAGRLQAAAIRGPLSPTALADLERTLTALTEVVAQDRNAGSDGEPVASGTAVPVCVLVLGSRGLAAGLEASDAVEVQTVDRADDLPERALALAPDVVLVDADQRGCREAVEALTRAGLPETPAIVVVGTFDAPEAAAPYAALGAARVLPRPASPDALARAVHAALADRTLPRAGSSPLGTVTIDALADRLAEEVRRGLVGAAEAGSEAFTVPLGEGVDVLSAVWGSVARIRELVTMRSGGVVRFRATGPEGAILLAPWAGGERRTGAHGRRQASSLEVSLARRRAVVVDDDPAVVWFLSGLLQRAGVQVLEAHDGERALELVLSSVPDLVITDVLMPGRDGFSLARELKRDVVVRDVPVILLSWKEDLLERARELGADAEGYLLKEATELVVLERVREVLRPRARIEARLQAGQEVRGRLDGLTPRLVLDLVCARGEDARVAFRDAAYLYEVEVRRGRVRSVARTAPDGRFDRGEPALAGLLGAAAGRFVVTPGGGPCACDLDAPLAELIGPPVVRARAVLRALAPERLARVARVVIDLERVNAYLATSPRDARTAIERLSAGVAPSAILAEAGLSPSVVADVLADVARRGAIQAVLGADGEDLLNGAPEPGAVRTVPAAADLPTPSPMFTFALSPAPLPIDGAGNGADVAPEPAGAAISLPAQPVAAESLASAMPIVALGDGEVGSATAAASDESRLPALPDVAAASPEPAPADGAAELRAGGVCDRVSAAVLAEPAGVLEQTPSGTRLAAAAPGPERAGEEDEQPVAERAGDEVGSAPEPVDGPEPATSRGDGVASAQAPVEPPSPEPIPAPARVDGGLAIKARIAFPGRRTAEPLPAPALAAPAPAGDPPARPIVFPPRARGPAQCPAAPATALDGDLAADPSQDLAEVATSVTPPGVGEERRFAGEESVTPPPGWSQHIPASLTGALRVTGITLATALLSFGLVRLAFSPRGDGVADAPAAAGSAAAPVVASAVAPPAVVTAPPLPEARVEALELPPGFVVGDGKGLLEIVTSGRESIYVGGTFVGRGPTRRVPLAPGAQRIEIRTEDGSRQQAVELPAGRRLRVSFGQ